MNDQKVKGSTTNFPRYFSGVNKEIFEKLPPEDKKPYILFGKLGICILLLFGILLFMTLSFLRVENLISVLIVLITIVILHLIQRNVFYRLIHKSNITSKLVFAGYGVFICFLFIIGRQTGIYDRAYYYEDYISNDVTISDTVMTTPATYDSTSYAVADSTREKTDTIKY